MKRNVRLWPEDSNAAAGILATFCSNLETNFDFRKPQIKKTKYADKKDKEKEYLKRSDIQEATNILGDLILIESGKMKDLTKN